ncbi:FHA domain-containing protein [Leptodesmis sp.]|uniref:FHA domain-containing protein n=1 Tax=Leptodesmis sp. TaxID=3100501 RepID=UPI00405354AD
MPSESYQHHLLIIQDDKGRREFILENPIYSIGRDPKSDIRLISQFVSRHHATLKQLSHKDGSIYYRIEDGDAKGKPSANGLLINGRKLHAHDLNNEDEIVFGPKVRAVYYRLERDAILTIPPDEFDITLISPNMIGEPEDDDDQPGNNDELDDDDLR